MTLPSFPGFTAVLVLGLASTCALAEVRSLAYERDIDQEVVALLPQRGAAPLVLQRSFLEPRKARIDPQRAARDTLQVLDPSSGKPLPVLSYKADAPLWIGPAQAVADGVVFPVRTAADMPAVYKYSAAERSVRRLPAPWERDGAKAQAPLYQRLFVLPDALVGVRAEVGVQQAEIWLGDAGAATRLDTSIANGDGRVISIDDVAEVDGRTVLLMMVAAANDKNEVWLLSFDRGYTRANARALRLETGTLASGKLRFVRSAQGVGGVFVVQRGTTYGRPTLKLFTLTSSTPLWSHEMPRVLGAEQVDMIGVCRRSFLLLRPSEDERLRATDVESVLLGPAGQEAVIDRVKMPAGTTVLHTVALADKASVWSYINFSRLESERRADGWYGWRGFQASADPADRYCKFE